MPVIINDFEVVAEPAAPARPPAATAGAPASPSASQAASAPNPLDILRIQEHALLRQLRLWAH
jgi:hypothetical protein